RWSEELCSLFEIPPSALPDVYESAARFGETNFNGALDHPIPICGVVGDSQGSLFAQRCYLEGMAKVTLGTGSSLLLNIGNQPRHSESGAVTTIGWVLNETPTYCYEGIITYSAATVAWLQNQLGLMNNPEEAEPMALSVEDNGGVYLVPAFAGLSAPYWKPEAKAAILGLTAFSNKNHIARAALESIAYQIKDILDMMKADAEVELKIIFCDGGATNNRFLMQFIADITGLELKVSKTFELSPKGAVFLGALGMGIYASTQELNELPADFTTYRPKMSEKKASQNYMGWRDAVACLLH
ncbi:MAG: FGGY-family carbohydrate kinase, partial [bacterium]